MKLKVNQLTVTLHLRVDDDITLQDSKKSNIASMVLDSLERGSRIINIGNNVFTYATVLRGGAGTAYNYSHRDKTYARIDNPPTAPGYFTAKAA